MNGKQIDIFQAFTDGLAGRPAPTPPPTSTATITAPAKHRKRPRAIRFDRGSRPIEIVRITPVAIVYRLVGISREYVLPHSVAFLKAVGLRADIDLGPRAGAIKRGAVAGA